MATCHIPIKRWMLKLLPAATVVLTALPFAVWSNSAHAFFPPVFGPPGTNFVPPATPPLPPPPFDPPLPPILVIPPPPPPPIVTPPPPPPPTGTPEPATLVSGLIGLAVAAGYRFRRKQ